MQAFQDGEIISWKEMERRSYNQILKKRFNIIEFKITNLDIDIAFAPAVKLAQVQAIKSSPYPPIILSALKKQHYAVTNGDHLT